MSSAPLGSHLARGAVAAALAGFVGLVAASCGSSHRDDCDFVDRRCNTVCDYYCDNWGCYPDCYDRCWDECGQYASTPAPPSDSSASPSAPPADAATDGGSSGSDADASAPGDAGSGVLCSPCSSNDACIAGALCVVRGGEAGAQGGFCSTSCQAPPDCPDGFACTQIGSTRHCLPTGGTSCP